MHFAGTESYFKDIMHLTLSAIYFEIEILYVTLLDISGWQQSPNCHYLVEIELLILMQS